MNKLNLHRETYLIDKLLYIDGTSGSGKSLVNSILSSFEDVELPIWDSHYEHLSFLYENNLIDKQAALSLIINFAENRLYDSVLGRHTNFRYLDGSSVFHNSEPLKNILKIFKRDSDNLSEDIKKNKKILSLGSHHLTSFPSLVSEAFKDKLRIIEIIRHPAYLIFFWIERDWANRMGKDPKDFTLWVKKNENYFPWFVKDHEEEYLKMNKVEKIIFSLFWIFEMREENIKKNFNILKNNLLTIPFEGFCLDPIPYLKKIEIFLEKKPKKNINKFLKKEKIPRKIYLNDILNEEKKIYEMKIDYKAKEIFKELCLKYEVSKIYEKE
ncbi:MAG: hypothetical protein CMQ53_03110 [Gammaproteobacteria bacterium]|nr:hypothetical protein [Gammaproteobacteria bacterium]